MDDMPVFEHIEAKIDNPLATAAAALFISYFDHTSGVPPYHPPELLNDRLRRMGETGELYIMRTVEDAVCGAALVTTYVDAGTVEVEQMVTNRFMRRAGLGRALMYGIAGEAQKSGCETVSLISRPEAVGFYLRLGFNKVSTNNPNIRKFQASAALLLRTCLAQNGRNTER